MTTDVEVSSKNKSSFSRLRPIEIMMVLLLLIVPFYYHEHLGGTGLRLPTNVSIWYMASLIICFFISIATKSSSVIGNKYILYFIAFPILITISSLFSPIQDPLNWFFRVSFIWMGVIFYIGFFQVKLTRGRVDRVLFLIVLSALLQTLIGIIQVIIPELFNNFLPLSKGNQPFGMFQQINNQATYLVTGLIIGLYLILRPYVSSQGLYCINSIKRITLLLYFCLSSFVISASGSRVGILAIIIASIMFIWIYQEGIKRHKNKFLIILVLVTIGAAMGSSGLVKAVDKTTRISEGYSTNARLGIYEISLDLIKEKPWLGYGIGSFIYQWHQQKIVFNKKVGDEDLISLYVTHPHNETLLWAVESGLIGLAGLVIFIFGMCIVLRDSPYNYRFLPFLIPILIHTQVELPFYTSSLHWFVFLFLLYVFTSGNRVINKSFLISVPMKKLTSVSVFTLLILVNVFFVHTLYSGYEIGKSKTDVWKITQAGINPYFSSLVESMQFKSIYLQANNQQSEEGTKAFVEWGKQYIKKEPSEQMYWMLTSAYNNLNQYGEMCQVATEGVRIYPSNHLMKTALQKCVSDI